MSDIHAALRDAIDLVQQRQTSLKSAQGVAADILVRYKHDMHDQRVELQSIIEVIDNGINLASDIIEQLDKDVGNDITELPTLEDVSRQIAGLCR